MKKLYFFALLVVFSCCTSAQNRNSIWCFGDSAGIDFNNTSAPSPISTIIRTKGTCTSISDSVGNILFYTGSPDINNPNALPAGRIYDRNNQIMQNGDSLYCRAWYHEMIIVPDPANSERYYLFHIGVTDLFGLYFTIIDMTQNNSYGSVISKNNQLRTDAATDCLQAVRHGNGRDWWLIFKTSLPANNFFYVYLITASGIQLDHVDSVGLVSSSNGGDLRFNSTGTKFAFCNWKGLLALYNFDRCNGTISVNRSILQEDVNGNFPYFFDCCFSSNDSLLYLSCAPYYSSLDTSQVYLYQLPLTAANIYASKTLIWQTTAPLFIGAVRLAPDNKIYVAAESSGFPYDNTTYTLDNMNLSVINQPNQRGGAVACDFQPFSFFLGGKRTYWGLPNNPNYDLGPLVGSLCDTINTVVEPTEISSPALNLSYQSAWQSVIVNASRLKGNKVKIYLTDISGRILFVNEGKTIAGYFTKNIPMDNFAAGIYLVTIVTEKDKISGKVVKD